MYERVRILKNGFRDERRVIIIDFNHLAYKYTFGARPLSVRLDVGNGLTRVIDTTIPAYAIKNIVRLGKMGLHYVVVCMDSPLQSRKEAFRREANTDKGITTKYKGTRIGTSSDMLDSINLTNDLLTKGGVTVLKRDNFEADDLAFAAIQKAKQEHPDLPIDVITNDWDYAPMVDEQVSVYISSRKRTFNATGEEHRGYVQLTPDTVEELANETSAYKNIYIPYNTVLLWKLLRGDKSDDISSLKLPNGRNKWTPSKMETLIMTMRQRDLLDPTLFAYSNTPTVIKNLRTNKEYSTIDGYAMIKNDMSHIKDYKMVIKDPPNYTHLRDVLGECVEIGALDEEDYNFMLNRYKIMNLNGAFLDTKVKRAPFVMTKPLTRIDTTKLQAAVDYLQIKIPRV